MDLLGSSVEEDARFGLIDSLDRGSLCRGPNAAIVFSMSRYNSSPDECDLNTHACAPLLHKKSTICCERTLRVSMITVTSLRRANGTKFTNTFDPDMSGSSSSSSTQLTLCER